MPAKICGNYALLLASPAKRPTAQGIADSLASLWQSAEKKGDFYQAFKSNKNAQQFSCLNKELQQTLADLNLTVQAKQITNQEQDMKDQKADAIRMKALQGEILSCYQENCQELKAFKGVVDKRELILARQLDSVKWQLQRMHRAATEIKSLLPPALASLNGQNGFKIDRENASDGSGYSINMQEISTAMGIPI